MSIAKKSIVMSAAIGALSLVLGATPAFAATASGQITQVEFNAANPTFPQLLVQLNGATSVNYYGQSGTGPGCGISPLSADSQKALQSIAQAAFLAGKNVTVYFTTCSGFNYLSDITMAR